VLVSGFANGIQIKRGVLSRGGKERKFKKLSQLTVAQDVMTILRNPGSIWHTKCFSFRAITSLKETTMSDPANSVPNTQELPRELLDLAEAINTLPSEHRQTIEPFLTRVIDSNRRRRRILNLVQDALSQLRLDMKYLAFDLEATRRERDEFRHKLEGTD
jgi:hypothetical protein